ncbi:MAG: 50S ribosomal protein L13 [Nitrospirae bacterium]|nr:50S ribosomal protein L13 [Nitrospirota bacterium]
MKTFMAKKNDTEKKWVVLDAENMVLGKLAVKAANILRGKNKPTFTPHVDTGDFVIVVNAEKVQLTGRKLDSKMYYRHTGYIGGLKAESARHLIERKPEQIVEFAIKGMLPKGTLGSSIYRKLKVYRGPDHPHAAQKPEAA